MAAVAIPRIDVGTDDLRVQQAFDRLRRWINLSPSQLAARAPYTFRGDGYFRPASGIDVTRADGAFIITEIDVLREIAGTSGATEVDLLVNGSSVFLPANRPKVLASFGNQAVVLATPDFPNVPDNARIELVILTAEDGDPQDLAVVLR